jgi:hypothetical protein
MANWDRRGCRGWRWWYWGRRWIFNGKFFGIFGIQELDIGGQQPTGFERHQWCNSILLEGITH